MPETLRDASINNDASTPTSLSAEYKKIRKSYDRESLQKKADILSRLTNTDLRHIRSCSYDTKNFINNIENPLGIIQIPLGVAGPLLMEGKNAKGDFYVPMATTEGALVLTYDLGMRLLRMGGPVYAEVVSKIMHLDPMFPVKTNEDIIVTRFVSENICELRAIAEKNSHHTKLIDIKAVRSQNNLILNCLYDVGDAHGLNMVNEATFNMCLYIEAQTGCSFFHRSHFSAVKHFSPRNQREGYGKRVIARAEISGKALDMLGVTATQMKDFTDRCIECGTMAEITAINVHASNGITAVCLATGQDMADISSSHVCKAACTPINSNRDLLYEVEIPNLLIATVGGGTSLGTQRECLQMLDCFGTDRADKLAEIIAATVIAGEFPTAAAVINRSYVDIHNKYGRNKEIKGKI